MARKLTDEERETKKARVAQLEAENAELASDLALLELEKQREDEQAALETRLAGLNGGGE